MTDPLPSLGKPFPFRDLPPIAGPVDCEAECFPNIREAIEHARRIAQEFGL